MNTATISEETDKPLNAAQCELVENRAFITHLRPFAYCTAKGVAVHGDALDYLPCIPDDSVDLIFTSPPFALRRKKSYGNEPPETYVPWFKRFAVQFRRILKDTGSLVIDIGGSWTPGAPTKSLYHYKLLLALVEEIGFHLAQEVFWHNPARLPTPAQWVCIDRCRLKDSVNQVWWLSKSTMPKADNRRVLTPYKPSQMALISGASYNSGKRPSEHIISGTFGRNNGGAIPPNFIEAASDAPSVEPPANLIRAANTASNDRYLRGCRAIGASLHPARIPAAIPDFFTRFLTEPGDLVLDPFSGSNVTGAVAEGLGRYWIAIEKDERYVFSSKTRFVEDATSLISSHTGD